MCFLIIATIESTLCVCFFCLNQEDYHWWWPSLLTSGIHGVQVFLYSIHFYKYRLQPILEDNLSTLLYFGYMIMISLSVFFMTGAIGFYVCLWFVNMLYSGSKLNYAK